MPKAARDNGAGVLVDTIHYHTTGVRLGETAGGDGDDAGDDRETVGAVVVPVEVRLRKSYATDSGRDRPVDAMELSLVCADPAITIRGTDVETLRAAMWGELDRAHRIEWEDHLLVTIEPALAYGEGVHEGLRLTERTVHKGTTVDGRTLLREYATGRFESGWRYRPWPGTFQDKAGRVTACIPATAANQAAMDEFRERIRTLRARLQDLVRPAEIAATLANLSGIGLLAAPDSDAGDGDGAAGA